MAIMKCPKCSGSGKIIHYEAPNNTTAGGNYEETCTSCGGQGYVTDQAGYGAFEPLVKD